MAEQVTLNLPLNRVEGDLDVKVEIADGVVVDAWCSGTMFRGFEQILVGRGPLDGLVLTPRICGICSTSHLIAAARALDDIAGATVPPNAIRLRNVALLAEHLQSDIRVSFLIVGADFASPTYRDQPLYEEAVRRFQPLAGETAIDAMRASKRLPELIAVLGGQWPHSTFAVPGGVATVPSAADLQLCRLLLDRFRTWYEQRVLGCSIDRWAAVRSVADLEVWLDECQEHHGGELGFYLRYGRAIGLDQIGRAHDSFLSYGYLDVPEGSAVHGPDGGDKLVPAGFVRGAQTGAFDPAKIVEDTAHSWFEGSGPKHPSVGNTIPYATGKEGRRYSWAKAPRYDGLPAETGPLADMVVSGDPLFCEMVAAHGGSVFVRQLARLVRPAKLLPAASVWLAEMAADGPFYRQPAALVEGEGCGLTHAARGALGHWVRLEEGRIAHYQVITPTAWHASPRDGEGLRGCTEEGLVGTPVADPENPVELGHVVRSFDHCLVCTVHCLDLGRSRSTSSVRFSP